MALARPTSLAIRNAQMLTKIEQAYRDTLIALANAIELRDHYTVGHTWRVTNFAVELARELGWSKERCKECEIGGVLHDVGKIAVKDAILLKPDPLTKEESVVMRTHPERGARLLEDIEFLRPIIPYVRYHHERYDGQKQGENGGYPEGLAGEDIPIEGRLIHVADAFDALTSSRPYKNQPFTPDEALELLKEDRGKRADPTIVDALVRCYEKGKIQHILQHRPEQDRMGIPCPYCMSHIHVPENAVLGDACCCRVCRHAMKVRRENGGIVAELRPAPESQMP